ncbi:hypothetical protein AAZX31_14G168200 [Glycine max]|uniref:Knottin scorpion toxin-like domain-containing protein n=1 Tax=Glycine max TaxID=3847 RepID=K7M7T3_SOYBN|nr:hypothetical protein JHK87_040451 [Glycine soja]KAG4963761.1 hypothetical protein JHK86_040629 [Glycine max]KAG4966246.1 hypothetical protein JHK85_041221 [Glycine max]KAG5111215.1 hypothetical protein JHK82_040438 [Glycine max]KAG5122506.1 hypothetical protein JHK84_040846 [Glycine max]
MGFRFHQHILLGILFVALILTSGGLTTGQFIPGYTCVAKCINSPDCKQSCISHDFKIDSKCLNFFNINLCCCK